MVPDFVVTFGEVAALRNALDVSTLNQVYRVSRELRELVPLSDRYRQAFEAAAMRTGLMQPHAGPQRSLPLRPDPGPRGYMRLCHGMALTHGYAWLLGPDSASKRAIVDLSADR